MTPWEHITSAIREWSVRPDYSDNLVDSFIRTAESNLSRSMRVSAMIKVSDGTFLSTNRVVLPPDWRELELVRVNNGKPLVFREADSFYADPSGNKHRYTLIGDFIEVGDLGQDPSGLPIEISYFANAPHIGDDPNWLFTKYYDIFLRACLASAYEYNVEVDKAATMSTLVGGWVADANEEYRKSKTSGSVLIDPRIRRKV